MLLGGFGLRLLFAWSGLAERGLVADDAYYYFTIARNIAHGLGPTFDTLTPTNGFHPLWLLMLVPIFALVGQILWIPVDWPSRFPLSSISHRVGSYLAY